MTSWVKIAEFSSDCDVSGEAILQGGHIVTKHVHWSSGSQTEGRVPLEVREGTPGDT